MKEVFEEERVFEGIPPEAMKRRVIEAAKLTKRQA